MVNDKYLELMVMAADASSVAPPAAAKAKAKAKASGGAGSTQQRPIHPAVLTCFGPGKGSGSSELSAWAYLTRPRPPPPSSSGDDDGESGPSPPLPNLVTAQSNSLRVYTVLPHAGTLALTAVYDNLAGTICSLDAIPNGTSAGSDGDGGEGDVGENVENSSLFAEEEEDDDGLYEIFADGNGSDKNNRRKACQYDGLLLGFAGHPRLSVVYPSAPMVSGGLHSGVGQGGVLLASSIVDLTPALVEKSMGGSSFLEQDIIVAVSAKEGDDDVDPTVSVVLGGGVAVASFSLPKGPRPDVGDDATARSSSWWRVASEPYVLPLPLLAGKIRDLGGVSGQNLVATAAQTQGRKGHQQTAAAQPASGMLPTLSHGFGDVVDIAFLKGYTEPTLLILHSNPRRGGGRVWPGRLGRTAEVPLSTSTTSTVKTTTSAMKSDMDDYGESMEIEEEEAVKPLETVSTGTTHGLTLTAVSLSVAQRRSVVLWSLVDALPVDSWKLVPHPVDGALVWGVNVVVYVSMGGKVRCALAVNGFAKIGCPAGMIPPPISRGGKGGAAALMVHLEANPSPLPPLSLQLDGARASFVAVDVALVCLGNGALHSLELHHRQRNGGGRKKKMFMSLFPLGHRVGGLGVASCLSVVGGGCHFGRFLAEENAAEAPVKKEATVDSVTSKHGKLSSGPKIQARGLVFIGSRMGDCTLLAFSMSEPTRLVVVDVDGEDDKSAFKQEARRKLPESSGSISAEGPARKIQKLKDRGEPEEASDDATGNNPTIGYAEASPPLTEEEILRLEEEELYRDDDEGVTNGAVPSIVSSLDEEDDDDDANSHRDGDEDASSKPLARRRPAVRCLSMFHSIRALDSLTGLGPLGGGVYGPVATCPSLAMGSDRSASSSSAPPQAHASSFSDAFSSVARRYVMPCGFGASGGLAVLTTPGRDSTGGTILCESDLCGMAAGGLFGLPRSGVVLLGRADGGGNVVLRGVAVPEEGDGGGHVEGFEELDVAGPPSKKEDGDGMNVDRKLSLDVAADVIGSMTLLAVSEVRSPERCFSVFFVAPHLEEPYSIVIMSSDDGNDEGEKESKNNGVGLRVNHVHRIKDEGNGDTVGRGKLSSITPMVSETREDGSVLGVTFGCVWTSGIGSVFNISSSTPTGQDEESKLLKFEVSESIFKGDGSMDGGDENFYDSNKVMALDVISLPNHVFDSPNLSVERAEELPTSSSGKAPSPTPDPSSSLSFPPDRLSMHGTWFTKLGSDDLDEPTTPASAQSRILIAVCRRSGLLQIFDNEHILASPLIEFPAVASPNIVSPVWHAYGISHGAAILGQSPSGVNNVRRPGLHEVETAEIRLFVTGPSLQPKSTTGSSDTNAEKDAWMLRSLCILVDTSQGDLHLYSGSKRKSSGNRLEFSRVPLSNVARPSDEAGRHLVKLRRKRIVPPASAEASVFRPNRLHRFCDISGEDGLFAATPRPLWFVSERGAPAVVSHKSRHVSPAGGRPVPVSGFCTEMPDVFQNAKNGFITIHERIGRVGSQRLTLYSGLWDVFAPHGILPGGGISIQKVPLGVTVRYIEFIDDASISTTSRPIYAMLVSHEIEADQSHLNDDGLTPEERQRIRDEKEAAQVRKQVEADLGGFDMEQEWVEEIEREECFAVDTSLGSAPDMPTRKYEVWLVDASSQWSVLDKYELGEFEHGTALKVMYLTDVVEDSDEIPKRSLVIGVGTSVIVPDGEDLASKGRILLFEVKKSKKRAMLGRGDPPLELLLSSEKDMALGPVTSLSSLKSEDRYRIVVGAGAEITVEQWGNGKLTQVGFYHAHMQVQEIVLFKTFFLLSDAYDSLHFLVWRESDKSLTLLAKDYEPTQVFAAGLISRGGAMSFVCHDDRQNLSFLQYAPTDAAARGGNKLVCRADFHMGSQTTSLRSHWAESPLLFNSCTTTSTLAALKQQDALFGRLEDDQRFAVNFGTSDGSFGSIVPLSEPTYWRLTALQSVMSNALESNCALSHRAWRLFRRSTRRAGCRSNDRKKGVIDGDVVMKFVDLPLPEQEDLASSIGSTVGLIMDNLLDLGCAASII